MMLMNAVGHTVEMDSIRPEEIANVQGLERARERQRALVDSRGVWTVEAGGGARGGARAHP